MAEVAEELVQKKGTNSPLQGTDEPTSSPLQEADADLDVLMQSIIEFEEESQKLIEAITTQMENSPEKYDTMPEKSPKKYGTSLEGDTEQSGAEDNHKRLENYVQEECGKMNSGGDNEEEDEGLTDKLGSGGVNENGGKKTISTKEAQDAIEAVMQAVSSFTGLPPNKTQLPGVREDIITISSTPTRDIRSEIEEEFGVALREKSKANPTSDVDVLNRELTNLLSLSGEAENASAVDGQTTAKKSKPLPPPPPCTSAATHTPKAGSQAPTLPPKGVPNPLPKPPRAFIQSHRPIPPPPAQTQPSKDAAFIATLKNKIAADAMRNMKKEDKKNEQAGDAQEFKQTSATETEKLEEREKEEKVQREKKDDEWKRGQALTIANAIKSRNKNVQQ